MINGDTASSPLWLDNWMKVFFCYIFIKNSEEGWERQNYYIGFGDRQSHYLYCTYTPLSGGGASRVHSLTTRWAYFDNRINVLLTNIIQGGEIMWRPIWIFGSLSSDSKITAWEAAMLVPLVLPSQRGLRHRTIWKILQNPPPSGGGASHVHGLKMRRAYVSISVSIAKYCC